MNNIKDLLTLAVEEKKTPGFSLVTWSEGESELSTYGTTDFGLSPVTTETIYDLASLTKMIGTTTRIFQLVDDRSLALHTRVRDIFPSCPNLKMSIRDLLLHRGGFLADFEDNIYFSREVLWDYLSAFHFSENQGTLYSDIGYLLLGEIIEKVDGCSLEKSFQKNIFRPLHMEHTGYCPIDLDKVAPTEDTVERGLLKGKVHDEKAYFLGKPAGHAGLFSTIIDIQIFLEACLGGKLFSSEILEDIHSTEIEGRTLGWLVHEKKGQLFHTGFTGGLLCIDLNRKKAMGLLTNRVHPSRVDRGYLEVREEVLKMFFSIK